MKKLFALLLVLALALTACAAPAQQPVETPETAPTATAAPEAPAETPAPEAPVAEAPVYQADVVIVGAGGAGMVAAIEAHDAGASVILLEKMNYAGGNTLRSEGGMNAAETDTQKANGIEDTVQSMIDDTMTGGKNLSDLSLVTYLAENSADTVAWLTSIGMDMTGVAMGAGASFARMHRSADGAKIGGVLVPVLMDNLAQRGIAIQYATKAVTILTENGAATGVVATAADGTELTFKGNAVVVTTGGFGANDEQFVKYRPDLAGFTTTNHPGSTGDGIVMAEAVGADTVDMDQIQTNPTVEVTTNTVISESVRGKGAIFVNQAGLRFTAEMQTRDVLSAAILEQPEKYAFEVFDQQTMDSMAALQQNYERGIIYKGETLAELAAQLDMDATALEQTIATWNEAVASQNDAAFGRTTGMDADLSVAPYYAIKIAPAVHYTMGGIKINTETQVISTSGDAIPGLYAAGEVTGGVHGGNRLGGNAVADIMVFGRQAGKQASAYALAAGKLELVQPEVVAAVVPTTQGSFTDGTYQGTGKGRNGDIVVEVVVSGGNITALNLLQNDETPGIFAGVERELLPAILTNQSLDVDTVTGATLSCNGVLEAISNALNAR